MAPEGCFWHQRGACQKNINIQIPMVFIPSEHPMLMLATKLVASDLMICSKVAV